MNAQARLFTTLRESRGKVIEVEMDGASTVADLLADWLAIDRKGIAILFVGERDAPLEKTLVEGNTLSIFPSVGGRLNQKRLQRHWPLFPLTKA
ncbi:MAG: hypothetical protein A2Y38_15270 [Spirochaetes bacterium GWB1_59_5]|nr:MAG: hypothetical protein A2Y38_15270 [Spirochaetes bacterium GWB1_59_5]